MKGGVDYGASDEVGYKAAEKKVHLNDLHATLLHLLGLDHEKLTYKYNGRRFRLTDVAGEVLHDIIATRYNDERPLIITSNLTIGDEKKRSGRSEKTRAALDEPLSLRDRLGDALISRLYEMCKIVRMTGVDFRENVLQKR